MWFFNLEFNQINQNLFASEKRCRSETIIFFYFTLKQIKNLPTTYYLTVYISNLQHVHHSVVLYSQYHGCYKINKISPTSWSKTYLTYLLKFIYWSDEDKVTLKTKFPVDAIGIISTCRYSFLDLRRVRFKKLILTPNDLLDGLCSSESWTMLGMLAVHHHACPSRMTTFVFCCVGDVL